MLVGPNEFEGGPLKTWIRNQCVEGMPFPKQQTAKRTLVGAHQPNLDRGNSGGPTWRTRSSATRQMGKGLQDWFMHLRNRKVSEAARGIRIRRLFATQATRGGENEDHVPGSHHFRPDWDPLSQSQFGIKYWGILQHRPQCCVSGPHLMLVQVAHLVPSETRPWLIGSEPLL